MQLSKLNQLVGIAVASMGAMAAVPALAQNADLTVTLLSPDPADGPAGVPGDVVDYVLEIANPNGAADATGIVITGTLPNGSAFDGASGCTPTIVNNSPTFPCTVAAALPDDSSIEVAIAVEYLPSTNCIDELLPDVSLTVAAANDPSDSTVTAAVPIGHVADVKAKITGGPATAGVGDTLTYDVTITNNGPCTAVDVGVDAGNSGNAYLVPNTLIYKEATGPCANLTDFNADGKIDDNDTCFLGDMTRDQVITYTKTYEIDELPSDLMSTGLSAGLYASSYGPDPSFDPDPPADPYDLPTLDPNEDNNLALSGTTVVEQDVGCTACQSAGGGLPLAVAALAVLFGRRRRWLA